MAPGCPEEVDVFTIPHSRMKELVQTYLDRLTSTNFGNEVHLTSLLETLCLTFREFIAHEQIENKFIMKKLRSRLKALSIQNTAVCNCHKDNQLIDMLNLFEDGYKCTKKSDIDRVNFGLKLRQALEEFTGTFLPHMAEEEEVFQPLLMQHFSVEELKQIKATVLQQHFRIEPEIPQEKFVEDNVSCKVCPDKDEPEQKRLSFDDISSEVVLKIFSYLNPKDLCRSAQVSTRFNRLAMDRSLWTQLFPVSWANGDWDTQEGMYSEEEEEEEVEKKLEKGVVDEDADVDESDVVEDWDTEALAIQRQSFMLTSVCKYLLPRVGGSVLHCDLAYSKGLTNGTLYKILSLCPNLEYLNLTQTRISDLGFKGLDRNGFGKKLKHLDLSGCLYITDLTLQRLATAFGQVTCHMTELDHMTKHDDVIVEEMTEEEINQDDSDICNSTEEDHVREASQGVKSMPNKGTCQSNTCCKEIGTESDSDDNSSTVEDNNGEAISSGKSTLDVGTSCNNTNSCCQRKETEDKTDANSSCHVDKNTMPGNSRCCQKKNKETCCMRNYNTAEEDGCPLPVCIGSGGISGKTHVVLKSIGSEFGKNSGQNGSIKPSKLIKCIYCGKVDDMIAEMAYEDGETKPDFQERVCNHGNQNICCHGRASTATHTDACSQVKTTSDRNDSIDTKYDIPFKCELNNCCQGTSANKGQGLVKYDPNLKQESIIENPKTKAVVGENGFRTSNDDFPEVCDTQGQGSGIEISDPGAKDNPNLEHLLENEGLSSEGLNNWEESWTFNDSDPVQTELPMMFIMDDLDLRFGMKTSDQSIGDSSMEQNLTLTKSEIKADCPNLEYLSLSGCYQITDVGLSFLAENGGLPNMQYLDLSGCLNLTGPGITELVDTCLQLDPGSLYYCDNIIDGPYVESASGCQNLQCSSRICCRCGE